MMPREIVIELGSEKAVARLLDDKAPKTCDLIWNNLPLESQAFHAKIAGTEIFFMVPLFQDEQENTTVEQEAGNICFWSTRQMIPIFYDKVPGLGPTTVWAKITENLKGIQREGRKIWMREGVKVRISRRERR